MWSRRENYISFILLFYIIESFCQSEKAFEYPLPKRLIVLDSILAVPDLTRADTATLAKKIRNLRELCTQYDDAQSELLAEIFQLRFEGMVDGLLNSGPKMKFNDIFLGYQHIIQMARIKKFLFIEILAFEHLAEVLRVYKRIGAELSYELKAYELIQNAGQHDLIEGYNMARKIGMAFYDLQDCQKSKFFIEKAISPKLYTPETRKNVLPRFRQFNMLNFDMLSQIHLRLGNFDSSEYYIDKAFQIYKNEDTTLFHFNGWRGIFIGNRANILVANGKHREAIPQYHKAIEIVEKADMHKVTSTFYISLISSYLKTGNEREALPLLSGLKSSINNMNANPLIDRGKQQINLDYYKLLLLMPNSKSDLLGEKEKILDSLEYWSAKVKESTDQEFIIKKELELELDDIKLKEQNLERNILGQKNLRNWLFGLLGILFILAATMVLHKQGQLKKETLKTQAIKEASIIDLKQAQIDLDAFKTSLIEKSKRIEILESQQDIASAQALQAIQANSILTDKDWLEFKALFENVHKGYLDRLKVKYPMITPAELRLIVLTKLNLNTREMATTLGAGTSAIRTTKSRLMKKIMLPETATFEEFIDKI